MKRILQTLSATLYLIALSAVSLADGNDWMTSLDGSLSLARFSIPGTHDTGALFEPLPGTAKCQNLTISGQLNAGIRFLDMRCRHQKDSFNIYHGPIDQKLTFQAVLDDVTGFLTANPGETVIMSVAQTGSPSETTRSFEATFDAYVSQNSPKWLLGDTIPTLDAARGKIVLFRRFGANALPKGIDASKFSNNTTFSIGETLRVQDRYVTPDNDKKWGHIEALLTEARDNRPDTLYVNFSSGYKSGSFGIPSITTVSDNINPRLSAFFMTNPKGRYGIIVMDFADAARSALIYSTNPAKENAPVESSPAH